MNAAATPFMELRNDITSSFKITLDYDMDNVNLKTLLINIYDIFKTKALFKKS